MSTALLPTLYSKLGFKQIHHKRMDIVSVHKVINDGLEGLFFDTQRKVIDPTQQPILKFYSAPSEKAYVSICKSGK